MKNFVPKGRGASARRDPFGEIEKREEMSALV